MKNDPVCWAEGLFLKPHHLQQADVYSQELISSQNRLDHPYNYGIYDLEINDELLKSNKLEVTNLIARLKDGTYVKFSGGLDLSTAGDAKEMRNSRTLIAYLAVPESQEQAANVSNSDSGTRYLSSSGESFDFCSGENPQTIDRQRLNCRLLLETQSLSGFDHIPICRLRLSNVADGTRVVDEVYLPPTIRTNGCREMARYIQSLSDVISSYMERWTEDVRNKSISFTDFRPEYLRPLFFLTMLGEFKAYLNCQTNSQGVHPYFFYQTFVQWLGRVAVLNPVNGDYAPAFPQYDHENLTEVFDLLLNEFKRRVFNPEDSNVIPVLFKGNNGVMTAAIEPEWLTSSQWSLYFGINLRRIPDRDREKFLMKIFLDPAKRNLYWKMGTQEMVESLFRKVARGVTIDQASKRKPGLPKRPIWMFFDFKDDQYWDQVKQSYTLSFRVDEELIHNPKELQGSDEITVVVDGRIYPIQLAVFAVKE